MVKRRTRLHADNEETLRRIAERLKDSPSPTKDGLNQIKMDVCRELHTAVPKDFEITNFLKAQEKGFPQTLKPKPTRTASGVNVVAVMTAPAKCPHGRCVYCPGGPEYDVPSSYTGHEPASMRGIQNRFDPYLQVKSRLDQLRTVGHVVSKVELIVMGGTFPAAAADYQEGFLKGCFDAIAGSDSGSLEEAKRRAERSRVRNVGVTFETRPDFCKEQHVDRMLGMGVTRVELGVQNVYDDIYRLVERGHSVQDVVEATRVARDAGLKVCYHMMPGLPGSSFERDLEGFNTLFSDPRFRPDMLKIYPCLVVRSAKLCEWWERGDYRPYGVEEAVNLLVEVKKSLPPWVRVMRVQRDIPAQLIVAGVKKGNLRELVHAEMQRRGLRCRCIRCREIGHKTRGEVTPDTENIEIVTQQYEASDGLETFVSAEDRENDALVGYARLRFPSASAHRPEIKPDKTAIIRELHVYGPLAAIGDTASDSWQHRGYGEALLRRAEKVSLESGRTRILVTSALGVREYFRRLGYRRVGPYMGKPLT